MKNTAKRWFSWFMIMVLTVGGISSMPLDVNANEDEPEEVTEEVLTDDTAGTEELTASDIIENVRVVVSENEFDPSAPAEPVPGEGIKVFFHDEILTFDEDEMYHVTYTGRAIKPLVRVTDNGVLLTEGIDYKVLYKNNKNHGTASVTVKGINGYTSSEKMQFIIDPVPITEADIGCLVTRNENNVKPVLAYKGRILKKGKDYKYTVDEGSIDIEGIGNFTGETSESAEELTAAEMKEAPIKVKMEKPDFTYDGTPKYIDEYLTVTDGTGEDTSEFIISCSDNVNAGKVTVYIIGTDSHKGRIKKTFRIKPYKGTDFDVSYTETAEYRQKGAKPYIAVSANETEDGYLTEGRDYRVKYSNNKTGGAEASFTLQFKGNYKGATYTGKYKVTKPSLEKAKACASGNYALTGDMVFNGTAKYQPKLYVVVDGVLVKAGEYSTEYSAGSSLSAPGENLTVTAKTNNKNYAGTVTVSYNVVDGNGRIDVNKAKVVLTDAGKSKAFGGKGERATLTPGRDFTVKIGNTAITGAEDIANNFDIYYADNEEAGKGTVILKGRGSYTGVFSGTFKINRVDIGK